MAKKPRVARKARRDPDDVDPLLHLDEEEVELLRKAVASLGRNGLRDSAMVLLAWHHGMRASEVCRLRWERVYLAKEEIFISRAKGSKSGKHILFRDDMSVLRRLGPKSSGYVFLSEAKQDPGPVSECGFWRIVQRGGVAAGLGAKVHPHQLRHACGFWMHKQGFDEREIQEWLGHRNIQNTVRYTALDHGHLAAKWKRLTGGSNRDGR